MSLLSRSKNSPAPPPARAGNQELLRDLRFEVIPLESLDDAIAALPANSSVSVTCSPAKGVDTTVEITEELARLGHRPVPHLAARMVESPGHLGELVGRVTAAGVDEVFVVAGDAEEPAGSFFDAVELIATLVELGSGLRHVGYAAYPDGHSFIAHDDLHRALHDKANLLADADLTAHVSTQMCFSPDTIRSWLKAERAAGFELPVHLGIAGIVDRTKLMNTGVRLGLGASLRYLKKNRAAVTKLMSPGSYEPAQLLDPLANDFERLGITGIHVFTFNQVEATAVWRQAFLASHPGS